MLGKVAYMTAVAYTRHYVTQDELDRAYRRTGHTSTTPTWSATLLIYHGLEMAWACPVLASPLVRKEYPTGHDWHLIAKAGELDWPPLRPEAQIWPALLAKHPLPTGKQAEFQAYQLGQSIEEMHRENLRRHYLDDAHIGGRKRNPVDINFDPLVRDWDATARELADFIDTHRPPKLTAEHRVMVQGVHLAQLEARVEYTKTSLGKLMRNAAREQGPEPRNGFKADLKRWSGVSRPTVDSWLANSGCCEGDVPDEDGTTDPGHNHTIEADQEPTR